MIIFLAVLFLACLLHSVRAAFAAEVSSLAQDVGLSEHDADLLVHFYRVFSGLCAVFFCVLSLAGM
jgi:hypothetical protein